MSSTEEEHISFFKKIKHLGKILNIKEKVILYSAVTVLLLIFGGLAMKYYLSVTKTIPANGGEYIEGININSAGTPKNINPILKATRPIDETISSLVFSSLFTYNNNGQLTNDLTKDYQISSDKKQYTIHIKKNIKWHDGHELTADDIVFTVNLLQNPNYNPSGAKEWNKETIKISSPDKETVVFSLSEPYAPFLSKLTFGILPKHLWKNINEDNFLLTDLNLKPIGSGPFLFDEIKKNNQGEIIAYKLMANKNYYGHKPFLDRIIFNFYQNQEEIIEAYNHKEIQGFTLLEYDKIEEMKQRKDTTIYAINTPQYFSILLNQGKSIALADKKVRQALQLGTNRDELIKEVFHGYGIKIFSPLIKPFIPEEFNYDQTKTTYSPEEAEKLLDEAGWKKDKNSQIRKKDGQELTIKLVTTESKSLLKTADLIKKQWEKLGIKMEIITSENGLSIKQDYLKPRNFEALLFGLQYSGNDPNLFFFWHSSGKKDPGMNFTLYDNEKVDKLLEESKSAANSKEKNKKYIEVSKELVEDAPAIFIYSPQYIYTISKKINGVQTTKAIVKTTDRLKNANYWYTKTTRVRK